MAVSKRLRYEILRRDNHTCRYCGASAPDAPLRVDHVIPVALGGTDTPANLVTACEPCNSGKSSAAPDAALVADLEADAFRWSAAMKQAAAEFEQRDAGRDAYHQAFTDAWNSWHYEHDGERRTYELPSDWQPTMDRFRAAGLPATAWPGIVDAAMGSTGVKFSNLFRYACGIAWRHVAELQQRAREILADPADG
ncbi:HNH endonuclease [Streptomyces sp. NPDC048290]|uniref:HNH endonuclease n=1 Tax=Streptomyces sp. NPDC048290 TaxID=3155811 RepID=UPI003425C8D7